jgi:hypothetical protein
MRILTLSAASVAAFTIVLADAAPVSAQIITTRYYSAPGYYASPGYYGGYGGLSTRSLVATPGYAYGGYGGYSNYGGYQPAYNSGFGGYRSFGGATYGGWRR